MTSSCWKPGSSSNGGQGLPLKADSEVCAADLAIQACLNFEVEQLGKRKHVSDQAGSDQQSYSDLAQSSVAVKNGIPEAPKPMPLNALVSKSKDPFAYVCTPTDPVGRNLLSVIEQRRLQKARKDRAKKGIMQYSLDVQRQMGIEDANMNLYCKFCNVVSNSRLSYKKHMDGSIHQSVRIIFSIHKKLKDVFANLADQNSTYCKLCEMNIEGTRESHIKSRGHAQNLDLIGNWTGVSSGNLDIQAARIHAITGPLPSTSSRPFADMPFVRVERVKRLPEKPAHPPATSQ